MITIKMPQAYLTKWLNALRSGEYKQCSGTLYNEKQDAYCCLGVLQKVVSDKIEKEDGFAGWDKALNCPIYNPSVGYAGLPTREWLDANNITFKDSTGCNNNEPYLVPLDRSAALANDGEEHPETGARIHQHSFKEIADAIEKCAVAIEPTE